MAVLIKKIYSKKSKLEKVANLEERFLMATFLRLPLENVPFWQQ